MATPLPHTLTQADVEIATADKKRKAADAKKLETEQAKVRALEKHVKRLEATIRTFLTADKLTEPQRQELIALLAGLHPHGKGLIDPKYAGINPSEQRLVDNFRAMDMNRRRMVSMLFAALGEKGGA